MRIKPLADHVVLKNVEVEVTTASGLILAGAAGKEKVLGFDFEDFLLYVIYF